jgi:4-amino-4-deoxy-L-arabinose transferase-like glycosyltransferase
MRVKLLLHNKKMIPFAFFLLAIALCLPLIWLDDIPSNDVAYRYAPMADAFARGDWEYAFHPRISMLLPTLAGIVTFLTGCSGFLACKLISCMFFALTVFPLYAIMQRVFDKKIAITATLMTIFCSHIIRLAYSGLRDTAKEFTFILAIYGLILLYRNRNALTGYLICAAGAALLILSRGDCVLYALLIMLTGCYMELYRKNKFHWPWRTICGSIMILIIISPALLYNYRTIGYPVPEARLGIAMSKMIPFIYNDQAPIKLKKVRLKKHKHQRVKSLNKKLTHSSGRKVRLSKKNNKPSTASLVVNFIFSFIKGFYPYFFLLAIPVIFMRIRRKKWHQEETILLTAVIAHAVLLVAQIAIFDHKLYVSRRYLLPVAPLAFGWSAICIMWVWEYLNKKIPRYANSKSAIAAITLIAALLYFDGAIPVIKNFINYKKIRKRQATLAIVAWIKNDYTGERHYTPIKVWNTYYSNQRPLVISNNLKVVGYMAGGQNLENNHTAPDYIIIRQKKSNKSSMVIEGKMCKKFSFDGYHYTVWETSNGGSQ